MTMALAVGARPAHGEQSRGHSEERTDAQLVLLRYPGGEWNPRPRGLARLAWELRKRTSVAIDLTVGAVDPATDELFAHPLVFWQGDQPFPALPAAAVVKLRQYLTKGGTLLVDVSDAKPGGGFDTSVRRELARILPGTALERVSQEHVLYKSFYLLDRHGGRVNAKPFLEGMLVGQRLAVIVSSNDLAGAMARDEFGQWEYDVELGGDATREVTFRLGVNVVMYAMCLDYKDDQVHIPFILQRRR